MLSKEKASLKQHNCIHTATELKKIKILIVKNVFKVLTQCNVKVKNLMKPSEMGKEHCMCLYFKGYKKCSSKMPKNWPEWSILRVSRKLPEHN